MEGSSKWVVGRTVTIKFNVEYIKDTAINSVLNVKCN